MRNSATSPEANTPPRQKNAPLRVDINCDLGEEMSSDADIMPFISSANIACGYHAGDETTMRQTIELSMKHGIAIGAHPSFADRENFGRMEMSLSETEIYWLVTAQVLALEKLAVAAGTVLRHVKPHGALYNLSARSPAVAAVIAKAVKNTNPALILVGLSGSCSLTEALRLGLPVASEAFADRRYQDDGSLVPRKMAGALIEDVRLSVLQVSQLVRDGEVTTIAGKRVPVVADTICIHGDGEGAPKLAAYIHQYLKQENIVLQAFGA
jgi:5-oxoprolinase (ATP-hydrolysing) subunit A